MPRVIHSDGGESDDSDLTHLSDEEQDMQIDNSDDEEDIPLAYLKRQHLSTAVVQSEKSVALEWVKTITEVTMEKTVEIGAVVDVYVNGVEDQEKETEEGTAVAGEKQNRSPRRKNRPTRRNQRPNSQHNRRKPKHLRTPFPHRLRPHHV